MMGAKSASCETSVENAYVGEEEPGCSAGDGRLEVFGESTASAEPSKGALDHPSARQELEAFDARRPLDDLDRPRAAIGQRIRQLLAAVDAVGEDVPQLWEGVAQRAQQRYGAVNVLDVGLVHSHGEQEAFCIGDDMA